MPRGSQARSGSNPATQPRRHARANNPTAYTIDSQEGQPHTRAKAGAPAGHTAGHHLHKPSPQASTTGSKSTRAGDTRLGGTCKDCKAEQHPAPAQATASTQASGKNLKPTPLKGGQTRQRRRTPPDLRRTAQTSGERQKKPEERNQSAEQQNQKNYFHEKLFLKESEK